MQADGIVTDLLILHVVSKAPDRPFSSLRTSVCKRWRSFPISDEAGRAYPIQGVRIEAPGP